MFFYSCRFDNYLIINKIYLFENVCNLLVYSCLYPLIFIINFVRFVLLLVIFARKVMW